jgi:AraC-like DNA-binding protein
MLYLQKGNHWFKTWCTENMKSAISAKPSFLKISPPATESILIKTDRTLSTPWHFHPQLELLYCIKGVGTSFIGQAIRQIEEGEILFFGENLPHTRLANTSYYDQNPKEMPEAIVIQFMADFLGPHFFQINEFRAIGGLMARAARGLKFYGATASMIGSRLIDIRARRGQQAILELLQILESLAHSDEYLFLNPAQTNLSHPTKDMDKIHLIYEYTISHFQDSISLHQVAALSHQSPSAFCRYFKSVTRKSYTEYLNEIRIGFACEYLNNESATVQQIAYESGFRNLAHFHKQFKRYTGLSPARYKKMQLQKSPLS